MSDKQKEVLDKFGSVIATMSDDDLERVLLIGEGMAIMSDIKSKKDEAKEKAQGSHSGFSLQGTSGIYGLKIYA